MIHIACTKTSIHPTIMTLLYMWFYRDSAHVREDAGCTLTAQTQSFRPLVGKEPLENNNTSFFPPKQKSWTISLLFFPPSARRHMHAFAARPTFVRTHCCAASVILFITGVWKSEHELLTNWSGLHWKSCSTLGGTCRDGFYEAVWHRGRRFVPPGIRF